MPTLSTGLVRAAGYADKIRRTMFAQLRDAIKAGEIDSKQVAYRVGRLNEILYKLLVETLGIEKHDAVRIMIDYEVSYGDIHFDWNSIQIEIYRYDEDLSRKAVDELKKLLEAGLAERDFLVSEVKRIGPTAFYEVTLESKGKVGAISVLDTGEAYAVSGAILLGGRGYRVSGVVSKTENIEVALKRLLNEAIVMNREISVEEAEKIIGDLS